MSNLSEAAQLAGFIAAHAVWSVSDAETLVPIYACATSDGKRHLDRLADANLADAVEHGRLQLASNPYNSTAAVLIIDGFVQLETSRTDALIIECQSYMEGSARFRMIVPYRSAAAPGGFLVNRPKLRELQSIEDSQVPELVAAFWSGVQSHGPGAKVWNEHLDESR